MFACHITEDLSKTDFLLTGFQICYLRFSRNYFPSKTINSEIIYNPISLKSVSYSSFYDFILIRGEVLI